MKKYILGFFLVLAMLIVVSPMSVKAYSLADVMASIKSLQTKVTGLQSQLTGQVVNSATVFCSATGKVGDANGSGNINAIDAQIITKIVAGLLQTSGSIQCFDANGDGIITQTDATLVGNYFTNTTPIGLVGQNYSTNSQPVCNSNTPPWIKVVSPNGGETFTAGQQIAVTWQSCNANPNDNQVMIILTSSSGNAEITTVPNTGNTVIVLPTVLYSGTVPLISGNYYKIKVQLGGNAMGYTAPVDSSDNSFTINNGTTSTSCSSTTAPKLMLLPTSPLGVFSIASSSNLLVFKISNTTNNCHIKINKMAVIHTETNGLPFVQKSNLRLKQINPVSGNSQSLSPTNVAQGYTDNFSNFNTMYDIAPNSSVNYEVYQPSGVSYFDPYSQSTLLNFGGLGMGVGQIDYEVTNSTGTVVTGGTLAYPLWGNILTITP